MSQSNKAGGVVATDRRAPRRPPSACHQRRSQVGILTAARASERLPRSTSARAGPTWRRGSLYVATEGKELSRAQLFTPLPQSRGEMEGQGDGRHNGPNCYRIPLPIGNGARNMETLGLRVFILNQEIIFSIHAMIRPPDDDDDDAHDDDGNTEDNNDEDENIRDDDEDEDEDRIEEDDGNGDDVDREENVEDNENIEDEDETEDSDGDADVEDNDGDVDDDHHGAHADYHADNHHPNDVHLNDENAVLLFRIRVRPLQHGDVFDDIFLELRLVNNDDFDEIDNNEEQNADANVDNIDVDDDDDGFENNSDDQDRSRDDDAAVDAADAADGDCRDDEGFEDVDHEGENLHDRGVVGSVADEERKDPVGPRASDEPLPGPSRETCVRPRDDDDADGDEQFQWWDESNSDSFSDNSGQEEERPPRRGASERRSSDDGDSPDDKGGGKKTCKKNFLSNSEDEDFARRSSERELSRKRRRGEGGPPSQTGSERKRFRHGDTSDSDPDDARPEPRRTATPSDGSSDETGDGRRDFAPSPSTGPAGRIPPVARNG